MVRKLPYLERDVEQLARDLQGLQRQVTRLHKPVPSKPVVAMLLKRIRKGMDYREIGDKFGIRASTASKKVNEAMQFLVHSKLHIIQGYRLSDKAKWVPKKVGFSTMFGCY